ncbi:MAG: hypothetical protein K8U57_07755 [Planctomycetes bacterium]|nr:hypothetical protein [Planctomycetota bacterium]
MILGMEIAMLVIGFLALVRGKLTLSATKVVEGMPARLLGMLAMTPLPLALMAGIAIAVAQGPGDPEKFAEDNRWTLIAIEAGIVIGVAVLVFGIGSMIAVDPTRAEFRKRTWEEDSYDRPISDENERRPWER